MEQVEQSTKELLNKAKKQGEGTAKVWTDVHELTTDLVQSNRFSDSYHIGLAMLDAMNKEFEQNRSALNALVDAVNCLTDELRAVRLRPLDAVLDRSTQSLQNMHIL